MLEAVVRVQESGAGGTDVGPERLGAQRRQPTTRCASMSLLRNSRMSPRASRAPALFSAAQLKGLGSVEHADVGAVASRSTSVRVSGSVDPLSMSTSSTLACRRVVAAMESTQVRRSRGSSRKGIRMLTETPVRAARTMR